MHKCSHTTLRLILEVTTLTKTKITKFKPVEFIEKCLFNISKL